MTRSERIQFLVLCLLFLTGIFVWYALLASRNDTLRVSFLDVGQGDAVFIESPSGVQMLVDGGRGLAVIRELSRAMPFFDRSIDVVLATHPDQDHIGGLNDVFERYRVGTFMHSGNERETATARELTQRATEEGSAVHLARAGQALDLGDGTQVRILYPDHDVAMTESNASSIVLQVIYGETEILLTGDAPKAVEEYVSMIYGTALASDVFKLGHHGSDTSNSRTLLALAAPEYAVASAGCGNRYGHPHGEVRDTVLELGIELLSTCEDGTITFISDGTLLEVK